MKKILPAPILQYMIRILVLEAALAVLLGVILFLKEHTLTSFGSWMFWAGLIIMALGASSLLGGWGITRSGMYQLGSTAGEQDISTRTKSDLKEEQSSFSFLLLCTGVGILAIVISRLI